MSFRLQRRHIQWAIIALALVTAILFNARNGEIPLTATQDQATDLPFDFYVLALSWSPAFCASEAGRRSPEQCGPDADFGFITHGLWPQFERGWPSFCQTGFGEQMPSDVEEDLLTIMPDRGLIEHQWDKHGTCSGLDQQSYAERISEATNRITIPAVFEGQPPSRMDADAIEQAFEQANPELSSDGIAVSCPSGRFREVRICFDPGLLPRSCNEVNLNGCRQSDLLITQR